VTALTLGEALRDAARRLAPAGVDDPAFDARLLLSECVGLAPAALSLHDGETLGDEAACRFAALIDRRLRREPVSHLLGRRGFWTLDLLVTADTLDPRPDSESLIEAVLAACPDRTRPLRLLDLGTGSGCLLLALLAEYPSAHGLGIDRSEAALDIARRNAARSGMEPRSRFAHGDWGTGLDGPFDLILSNPPYIPSAEIDQLAPEVACFEPRSALDGGPDGLDCYRRIAPDLARLLTPAGLAALEIGAGQAEGVETILAAAGLRPAGRQRDLGGIERCLLARPIDKG
jgi:release factor glutamine methyltransferase